MKHIDIFSLPDSRIEDTFQNFVDHPEHYGGEDNPYEAIKVIEAWDLDFHLGNVVKYISRAGKKHDRPLEDIRKAKWYLDRWLEKETKDGI